MIVNGIVPISFFYEKVLVFIQCGTCDFVHKQSGVHLMNLCLDCTQLVIRRVVPCLSLVEVFLCGGFPVFFLTPDFNIHLGKLIKGKVLLLNQFDTGVIEGCNHKVNPVLFLFLGLHLFQIFGFNDNLGDECLEIAKNIYSQTNVEGRMAGMKLQAAVELYLTTSDQEYLDFIYSQQESITSFIGRTGWFTARIAKMLETKKDKRSKAFVKAFRAALVENKAQLDKQAAETPYGVPYRPSIWGAGWDIQRFGFEYYFLADAYPEIFPKETIYNALNFILGCHPGINNASFASGVGARSATVAYGLNRADWSYIPGGVVSGTALIRPDFPELLEFPYLWQQTEYVLGGGSSHYMFLVLAANKK